jgi:hypothetical protein
MIKLFREVVGESGNFVIVTDAENELTFIVEFAEMIESMIEESEFMVVKKNNDGDHPDYMSLKKFFIDSDYQILNAWGDHLADLLPQVIDVCCKLRGYKNRVTERRILISGDPIIDQTEPIAEYPKDSPIELLRKKTNIQITEDD